MIKEKAAATIMLDRVYKTILYDKPNVSPPQYDRDNPMTKPYQALDEVLSVDKGDVLAGPYTAESFDRMRDKKPWMLAEVMDTLIKPIPWIIFALATGMQFLVNIPHAGLVKESNLEYRRGQTSTGDFLRGTANILAVIHDAFMVTQVATVLWLLRGLSVLPLVHGVNQSLKIMERDTIQIEPTPDALKPLKKRLKTSINQNLEILSQRFQQLYSGNVSADTFKYLEEALGTDRKEDFTVEKLRAYFKLATYKLVLAEQGYPNRQAQPVSEVEMLYRMDHILHFAVNGGDIVNLFQVKEGMPFGVDISPTALPELKPDFAPLEANIQIMEDRYEGLRPLREKKKEIQTYQKLAQQALVQQTLSSQVDETQREELAAVIEALKQDEAAIDGLMASVDALPLEEEGMGAQIAMIQEASSEKIAHGIRLLQAQLELGAEVNSLASLQQALARRGSRGLMGPGTERGLMRTDAEY